MKNPKQALSAGDKRLSLGRSTKGARFTASPSRADLPRDYAAILEDLKRRISGERLRMVMSANAAMVLMYWDIGRTILERQAAEGWGARIIDRLSSDLRNAFPEMKGLSPRNLKYMRAFAEAWPDKLIVQQLAAQIPWFHNCLLLDKVHDPAIRQWYIRAAIEQGWSRNILSLQIENRTHARQGKAISNFPATLPPGDSDMAGQMFKDPYIFDFLGTADPRREREVEQALTDHIQRFLLELGAGFAFVGRQVHLEIESRDFYLDLLFYHVKLRCYIVVELKATAFDPAFIGQLNLYLSAVDDLIRQPEDKLTIGLLLCREKNKIVVEYALRDLKKPIGVASWETRIVKSLPKRFHGVLPSIEEIEKELAE